METASYVYLIAPENKSVALTKIGKANNPESRLREPQTSSPYDLRIAATFECQNVKSAYTLEGMLHNKYQKHRQSGEWFALKAEDILFDVVPRLSQADNAPSFNQMTKNQPAPIYTLKRMRFCAPRRYASQVIWQSSDLHEIKHRAMDAHFHYWQRWIDEYKVKDTATPFLRWSKLEIGKGELRSQVLYGEPKYESYASYDHEYIIETSTPDLASVAKNYFYYGDRLILNEQNWVYQQSKLAKRLDENENDGFVDDALFYFVDYTIEHEDTEGNLESPVGHFNYPLQWEMFSDQSTAFLFRHEEDAIAYAKQIAFLYAEQIKYPNLSQLMREHGMNDHVWKAQNGLESVILPMQIPNPQNYSYGFVATSLSHINLSFRILRTTGRKINDTGNDYRLDSIGWYKSQWHDDMQNKVKP